MESRWIHSAYTYAFLLALAAPVIAVDLPRGFHKNAQVGPAVDLSPFIPGDSARTSLATTATATRTLENEVTQSVVIARSGRLARVEFNERGISETTLPGFDSGVIATFGRSRATSMILLGVGEATGLALYMGMLNDPRSNWMLVSPGVLGAQWSPDGQQFLYISTAGVLTLGGSQGEQQVAKGVLAASFSPSGKMIALVRVTSLPTSSNPADSTDRSNGERSAQASRRRASVPDSTGLYVYDLASQGFELVSHHVLRDYWFLGYAPAWSPDGTKILYFGDRADGDSFPFWVASLKALSAGPLQANTRLPHSATPLYWSPDNNRALFGSEVLDSKDELWSLDFSRDDGVRAELLGYGRPVAQVGRHLLVEGENGRYVVDSVTGEISQPRERPNHPVSAQGMGGAQLAAVTPTVYDVKYCEPLISYSAISSYKSHDSVAPCNDGGYKYNCSANGSSYRTGHKGTDFAADLGTLIFAGAAGIVTAVQGGCGSTTSCTSTDTSCNGKQGNYVNVKHSNGAITRYMHMQKTIAANAASVTYTSVLGYVGSTGNSTGCHVHFQVDYNALPYDPYYGSCSCTSDTLWTTSNCARSSSSSPQQQQADLYVTNPNCSIFPAASEFLDSTGYGSSDLQNYFSFNDFKSPSANYVLADSRLVAGLGAMAQTVPIPGLSAPGNGAGYRIPGANPKTPCGAHCYGTAVDLSVRNSSGVHDCRIWNALAAAGNAAGGWVEPASLITDGSKTGTLDHFHVEFGRTSDPKYGDGCNP